MHSSVKRLWLIKPFDINFRLAFWINALLSACLLVAVVVLFSPALDWAWRQIARPDRQYHILVSLCFIALCSYRLAADRYSFAFARKNVYATLIVCVASTAYVLNQRYLQFNALSIALFLMFCFGLLGHFLTASAWRTCVLPFMLAMLVLPFEGYLDIFLGFPMRLLSAESAVSLLHALGVETVSSDTVLLIDNRAAIVDIDCSGIRGFWIGGIFYCAITWIERYRVDLRWLVLAAIAASLLFVGNVFRVVLLVLLDLVFDQAHVASALHETLGLFFFSLALLCSWLLLRRYAQRPVSRVGDPRAIAKAGQQAPIRSSVTLMLLAIVTVSSYLVSPPSNAEPADPVHTLVLEIPSQGFNKEPLNAIEAKFFLDNGASAYKYAAVAEHAGIQHRASVLVVLSGHWKAQHLPEHCYIAQGYKVVSSNTKKINTSNAFTPFRQLSLVKNGSQAYTSDYWFQSGDQITVNYSRRVLSQLKNRAVPWAMVSVLWHDGVPDQAREKLLINIREIVSKEIKHHG